MPKRDGTGPSGRGPGQGAGRKMGGNRPGAGPEGGCVCPGCGVKIPHRAGVPCNLVSCPECGARMARE